jgi:hypothetical protein
MSQMVNPARLTAARAPSRRGVDVADRMDPAAQWLSCSRKVRYASPERAEAAMVKIWLDGRGDGLKIYRCRVTEQETHWHVGHVQTWWARHAQEEN